MHQPSCYFDVWQSLIFVLVLHVRLFTLMFFLRDFLDADYIEELHYITDFFFDMLLAVSALTSAAISVDRLLALLLRLRYRHVVTSCRVRSIIACFWVIAILNASFCNAAEILFSDMTVRLASYWEFFGLLVFAIVISTFSYTKIFFTIRHQKNPGAQSCTTKTIKTRRKSAEHSAIQEDSV